MNKVNSEQMAKNQDGTEIREGEMLVVTLDDM